jgi:hypothetical protein
MQIPIFTSTDTTLNRNDSLLLTFGYSFSVTIHNYDWNNKLHLILIIRGYKFEFWTSAATFHLLPADETVKIIF